MYRIAMGLAALSLFCLPVLATADQCVECHRDVTPRAVDDWELSKHSGEGVGCDVCHGEEHSGPMNVGRDDFAGWVAERFAGRPASNSCSELP